VLHTDRLEYNICEFREVSKAGTSCKV
jgi:hypothetical protein